MRNMKRLMRPQAAGEILLLVGLVAVVGLTSVSAWAGTDEEKQPSVAVQIGPKASNMEQYAAEELCGYLKKLYGIQTRPGENVSTDAGVVFLVGSPKSNPAVGKYLPPGAWPELSDQGLAIVPCRVEGKPAVVVGGGSPRPAGERTTPAAPTGPSPKSKPT